LASLPIEVPEVPADAGDDVAAESFRLIAPWLDGAPIDTLQTCDGVDLSPALSWTVPPDGTVELAIAMVDESVDAATPFVHWIVAGISPLDISVIEGGVPIGAVQAENSLGDIGYSGPCPPPGAPAHVYRLTIYALGQQVELADGAAAADLLGFVQDVSIGSAEVGGTYAR
jgi:Raf kinase inhibitor-like YbhB/YbcL family protein